MDEDHPTRTTPTLGGRLLLTLGMLAIARIGVHIPLPGIDAELFRSFGGDYLPGGFMPSPRWSIFALGIGPYISASVLVLLASGLIEPLRRLRDGGERTRNSFDLVIISLTMVIGLLQAYGAAIFVDHTLAENAWTLSATDSFSQPVGMLTMITGTLLLVCLAHVITRYGVGNGVALIILTTSLADLLPTLFQEIRFPIDPSIPPAQRLLLVVLAILFIVAVTVFLRAKRLVRLVPLTSGQAEESSEERPLDVPIRVNTAGAVPLVLAQTIVMFPFTLASLGVVSENALWAYGSLRYWIANSVLIILWTFLVTSWIFNAKNMLAAARRWGFGVAGGVSDEECGAAVERALAWRTGVAALCLCVLSLTPLAVSSLFGVGLRLSFFLGTSALVSVAIILDTLDQVRRRLPEAPDSEDSGFPSEDTWVPVLSLETWLEIEAARRVLERAGIRSAGRFSRAICATGTLAPWEACRPTFPSLVVYRGLGGGHASVLVPPDQLEQAQAVLAPYAEQSS